MTELFTWVNSYTIAPWVALVIIGYVLMVVEMLMPGFGIPGISGLCCLAVGLFFLSGGSVLRGLILTLIVAALLGLALFVCMHSSVRGRIAKSRLILNETSTSPETLDKPYDKYLGCEGVAQTVLRPAGVCLIEGERVNVMTDGDFIAENKPVVVTRVEGNSVFVRAKA